MIKFVILFWLVKGWFQLSVAGSLEQGFNMRLLLSNRVFIEPSLSNYDNGTDTMLPLIVLGIPQDVGIGSWNPNAQSIA